jgi:ribonuclease HII
MGQAEVEEVDRINVYWAAMEARRRAVEALTTIPAHVLVDGKRRITGCRVTQTPVVGGDARSASIAAASIVAKVTRDSLMGEYARLHPEYGFERHKGYATAAHFAAVGRFRTVGGESSFVRTCTVCGWAGAAARILERSARRRLRDRDTFYR